MNAIGEPMFNLRYFFRQLGISVLGASLVWFVFPILFPPQKQIAVVDVNRLIAHFVQAETKQALPLDQLKKHSVAFGQTLESVMQTIAKRQHVILLPKEAVIAGAKDITPDIQKKLDAQLGTLKQKTS